MQFRLIEYHGGSTALVYKTDITHQYKGNNLVLWANQYGYVFGTDAEGEVCFFGFIDDGGNAMVMLHPRLILPRDHQATAASAQDLAAMLVATAAVTKYFGEKAAAELAATETENEIDPVWPAINGSKMLCCGT